MPKRYPWLEGTCLDHDLVGGRASPEEKSRKPTITFDQWKMLRTIDPIQHSTVNSKDTINARLRNRLLYVLKRRSHVTVN